MPPENDVTAGASQPASVKPLPTVLRVHGTELRQRMRIARAAFYERFAGHRLLGFEVVKPIVRSAETIKGREYPCRECYPGDEAFGSAGWYYVAQEEGKALARYVALSDGPTYPSGTSLEPLSRPDPSRDTLGSDPCVPGRRLKLSSDPPENGAPPVAGNDARAAEDETEIGGECVERVSGVNPVQLSAGEGMR